jgi:hypothetical protein
MAESNEYPVGDFRARVIRMNALTKATDSEAIFSSGVRFRPSYRPPKALSFSRRAFT